MVSGVPAFLGPSVWRHRNEMSDPAKPPAPSRSGRWRLVAVTVVLAWLGLFIHNALEFPAMPFSRPEYSAPRLGWLLLFLIWLLVPDPHWPANLLLGWAAISLAGAILTVLPLPILPFRPEQSLRHYVVHVIYAATQFPVLWLMWKHAHTKQTHGEEGAA